jgi:hypothetical protein
MHNFSRLFVFIALSFSVSEVRGASSVGSLAVYCLPLAR